MGVSKVVYGETTLIDVSGDTVTADKLYKGRTALGADGENVVGTIPIGVVISQSEYNNLTSAEKNDNTYHFVSDSGVPSGDSIGNAAKSKVVYGNTPIIDLSEKNVSKKSLLSGYTAHGKNGGQFTGIGKNVVYITQADYDLLPSETKTNGNYYFVVKKDLYTRVYQGSNNKKYMFFEMGDAKTTLPADNSISLSVIGEWLGSGNGFLSKSGNDAAPWQTTGSYSGWNISTLQTIDYVSIDREFFSLAKPISLQRWFKNLRVVTTIGNINNLDVSEVLSMEETFRNCYKVVGYDLTKWKTHKVTNMKYMFGNNLLESGTSGNVQDQALSGIATYFNFGDEFDTSHVTTMERMFQRQDGLNSTNDTAFNQAIHNFDVSNVLDMTFMFSDCHNISKIDLSNWDTSNVVTFKGLFYRSRKLADIRVNGKFNTDSAVNLWAVFDMYPTCQTLLELDVSTWDTSKVTDMAYLFTQNPKLKTIYASDKFVITAVTNNTLNTTDDYGTYSYKGGDKIFTNDTSLVGGNGTKYSTSGNVKEYARIDRPGTPGYFTEKTEE